MGARWQRLRTRVERVSWVDHHRRAWTRANGLRFTRWAASMALFGYLALFPLAVLAFIVFGVVLSRAPELRAEVESFLKDAFPLLFDPQGEQAPVDIEDVARTTASAGVVAVIALLYAGLGWVDASFEAVRRMQGAMRRPHNMVLLKLQDAGALLVLGVALLVALLAAVLAETVGSRALDDWAWSEDAGWLVESLADVLSGVLLLLVVVGFYAFSWWHRPGRRWSVVLRGALLATVVLVLMLRLSFLLVGRTLSNPVYGTLAVAAALLLFLYFGAVVLLYFASWVAVLEGAPETDEELAFQQRRGAGEIVLPAVSSTPDVGAGTTSPPR